MTTPDILAALAADPNVAPAFARAIRPRPLCDSDEPDYSDEAPLRDDRFADCAAADFEARRCGR
jgi:hypothetical protein